MRPTLPDAVIDLAHRLGTPRQSDQTLVTLTQTGRMKTKMGSLAWMPFTATQTLSTTACEFHWQARFGPLGILSVCDALAAGKGQFDVVALGFIPIQKVPPIAALTRGELMRYLAELAWVPDALVSNPSLRWRAYTGTTLAVSAGEGATAAKISMTLDTDGRIARIYAADRPYSVGASFLPTPWRGQFSDYRFHEGRWIPFAGEVAWEIDGVWETYFECRLESWNIQ